MMNENDALEQLFQSYRAACPEIEPSAAFMPVLWQRIEAKSGFWSVFEGLGRKAMTASAALCLVLLALNVINGESRPVTLNYTDALLADQGVEKTYYAEAVRNSSPESGDPQIKSNQP